MNYWLIKSEGDCYSIDNLQKDKKTAWSGVRNFQARNYMRDQMKVGDLALFYHSNGSDLKHPTGVYGIARVASLPYPDKTAFDPKDEHFDEKNKNKKDKDGNPKITWMLVDFEFVKKFKNPVSLSHIKKDTKLEGMIVRQKGSRLSIQPVAKKHFTHIVTLGQ